MRTNVKFLLLIISVGFINLSCSDNSVAGDIPDEILNTGTNENTTDSTSESTKATAVGTVIFEDNFDQTDGLPDKTKWVLCPNTGGWGRYMSVSYDRSALSGVRNCFSSSAFASASSTIDLGCPGAARRQQHREQPCQKNIPSHRPTPVRGWLAAKTLLDREDRWHSVCKDTQPRRESAKSP